MTNAAKNRRDIRKLGKIKGWLHPFSAEAILAMARAQHEFTHGAVAEIGVHHGKLFFVMALSNSEGEKALAIDLFDQQDMNVDRSGKGDKSIFLRHATRVMSNYEILEIIEGSSLDLTLGDIINRVGRVRLFSVDGGHTRECALNDLRLAEMSLTDDGLVVMDDVFNEFWPEVMAGFVEYLEGGKLVPFAITPGKVYLCRPTSRARYLAILREFFPHRMDKTSAVMGHDVLIIGLTPWTLRRAFGTTALGRVAKRIRNMAHGLLHN